MSENQLVATGGPEVTAIPAYLDLRQVEQLEEITEAMLTPLRQDCVRLLPARTSR